MLSIYLIAQETLLAERPGCALPVCVSSPPGCKGVVDGQEIGVVYGHRHEKGASGIIKVVPDRKDALANAASASCPNGVMNGLLEVRAAAIVKAGSRHLNIDAKRRNLPRWTSVGSLDNKRPIGVISSVGVSAFTCTVLNITGILTLSAWYIPLPDSRLPSEH